MLGHILTYSLVLCFWSVRAYIHLLFEVSWLCFPFRTYLGPLFHVSTVPKFFWIFTLFQEVSAYCGTLSQREILAVWSWQFMWPILLVFFRLYCRVSCSNQQPFIVLFSFFLLLCILVVAHGLSCPAACGILIAWPGIEPASSVLEGRSLLEGRTLDHQGSSHPLLSWSKSFQFWMLFSNWRVLLLREYLYAVLLFHFLDPQTPHFFSLSSLHRHWWHADLVDAVTLLYLGMWGSFVWVFFVVLLQSCLVLPSSWLLILHEDSLQK